MSSVTSVTSGTQLSTSKRTFISTRAFHTYFFSYTVTQVDFDYVGTLGSVSGANASTCPENRILRTNGKKLIPGVNPGVSTYMVGVYDAESFLNGYIDPTSAAFTPVDSDKPYFYPNNVDPTASTTDQGAPVYSRGNVDVSGSVFANGGLDISGAAYIEGSTYVNGALDVQGEIVSVRQIRCSTQTPLSATGTVSIDVRLSQIHRLTTNQNTSIIVGNAGAVGSVVYLIIQGDTAGRTIDFNTGFRTQNAGIYTIGATLNTFTFVSDGSILYQVGQALSIAV